MRISIFFKRENPSRKFSLVRKVISASGIFSRIRWMIAYKPKAISPKPRFHPRRIFRPSFLAVFERLLSKGLGSNQRDSVLNTAQPKADSIAYFSHTDLSHASKIDGADSFHTRRT